MADPSTLLLLAANLEPNASPPTVMPLAWAIAARGQAPATSPKISISQPEAIVPTADAPPREGSLPHPPKVEGSRNAEPPTSAGNSSSEIPPPTVAPKPLLAYGATGGEVVSLQIRLQQLDFYRGELDGIYGSQTETAIYNFQLAHGLVADGVAGPQTWESLRHVGRQFSRFAGPSDLSQSEGNRSTDDLASNDRASNDRAANDQATNDRATDDRATNTSSTSLDPSSPSQTQPSTTPLNATAGNFFGGKIQAQLDAPKAQDDRDSLLASDTPTPPDTPDQNSPTTSTNLNAEGSDANPPDSRPNNLAANSDSNLSDSFVTEPAPSVVSEAPPQNFEPAATAEAQPTPSSDHLLLLLLISIVIGFASGGGLILLLRYRSSEGEDILDDADLESEAPNPWPIGRSATRSTHSETSSVPAASGLQAFSSETPTLPPTLTIFPDGAIALSPAADGLPQAVLDWWAQWQKSLDELWWPPAGPSQNGLAARWLTLPPSWQARLREWVEQEQPPLDTRAIAAAQELTPRSPVWLQTAVWLLTGAVSISIVWALVTRVEQHIPTQGEFILPSPTKLQVPIAPSTIQTVHVAEGQMVQAGDLLISLDANASQAELEQLEEEQRQLRSQLEFLQAQLSPEPKYQAPPAGLDSDLVTLARHRAELLAETSTPSANLPEVKPGLGDGLNHLAFHQEVVALVVQQLEDELAEVQVQLSEARKALNRTKEQLTARVVEPSVETPAIAKIQIIQQQQDLNQQQVEVNRLTATEQQLRQAILEARQRAEAAATIPKAPLPNNLQEVEIRFVQAIQHVQSRLEQLEVQIAQSRTVLATKQLKAPIAGKVFDLRTPPPGTPIDPQQPILKILPQEAVVIEVQVDAPDLNNLTPGTIVDLYLEDQMEQSLGTFEGSVVAIAASPQSADNPVATQRRPQRTSVQIQLTQPLMTLPDRQALYNTTMPVNVQIQVGDRTIASVLKDWLRTAL